MFKMSASLKKFFGTMSSHSRGFQSKFCLQNSAHFI